MKTTKESFDDIVFENRNKDYGAYELRRRYSKRGTIALLISFTFFSIAVGGPLISSIWAKDHNITYNPTDDGSRIMERIDPDKPLVPPPPPPPEVDIKEIRYTMPTIVDSITDDEIEFSTTDDLLLGSNSGIVDTASGTTDNFEVKKDDFENKIVDVFEVEEKPFPPGGESGLLKYVAENTKYPQSAIEQNIEGTVYVRFVVTKTGEVGETKVMRSVDPSLEAEALRVIKSLPKWTPGKINGRPVNVWFVIPVKFVLK